MKIKKIVKILLLIAIVFIIFWIWLSIELNKNKIDFSEVEIDIKKTDDNFCIVENEEEFIRALENKKIQIIEIINDLDLGYNTIKSLGISSPFITKHNEALTHPVLIGTGVSKLNIDNRDGLIIYSSSGSKILHANIIISNSENIKFENIFFDELWEWDEETKAEYDRNDWDFFTIKNSKNIQIKN
ncbi:MAG: hypothetical protein IJ629_03900 [Clostridia bacterium]|nr:hypothetical protein [Clostridia bacterium]